MTKPIAFMLAVFSTVLSAGPGDWPEEVLHTFAKAYATEDIVSLAGCFSGSAIHNGRKMEKVLLQYHRFFRRHSGQKLVLHDVVISPNGHVTAWMQLDSKTRCAGPLDVWFNSRGYIQRMENYCSQDPDWMHASAGNTKAGIDHALAGQSADIATTAAGLATGLQEANPIVAGVAPVAVALKLGLGEYAETLPAGDCHALKDSLATVGWGAAGWNLCTIAAVGSGGAAAIPCIAAGIAAGAIAHQESTTDNFMLCRKERVGVKFTRIDASGVYRKPLKQAEKKGRHQTTIAWH